MKKISVKTLYLLAIISIGLVSLGVGSTFAMFTASANIENPISLSTSLNYNSDVLEIKEVRLSANEKKTVTLTITNSTSDSLNYSAWYIGSDDINIGLENLNTSTTGTISASGTISINVVLKNNSSSSERVTLGVSSSTTTVVLSSNMTMIPYEIWSFTGKVIDLIPILYKKTGTVTEDPEGGAIVLDVDTANGLIKDSNNNIRYYGANPNNYIKFNCETYPDTNCETWRIIGIVDGKVKLIRNYSIGRYSWDTSPSTINSGLGINEWSQADLMKLLNPGYESETVGGSLYYNSGSGTCYNGQSNVSTTCDFTSTGIKNNKTREKIATTIYYTGAWDQDNLYPNTIFVRERGTQVISNPSDGVERTTTWTGKIALAYPSDYGYASDLSLCNKTLNLYNDSTCTSNNWMKNILTDNGQYVGWLITPNISSVYHAWGIYAAGGLSHGQGIRTGEDVIIPVLYLTSEEIIIAGDGSSSNPYILSA